VIITARYYLRFNIATIQWKDIDHLTVEEYLSCIYRIQLMDPQDPSRPLPIPRFAGIDLEGIVELGQTINLAEKMRSFPRGLRGYPWSDREGYRLCYYFHENKWLRDTFGSIEGLLHHIKFTYHPMEKKYLKDAEAQLIDYYCSIFGEPPITNLIIPNASRNLRLGPIDISKRVPYEPLEGQPVRQQKGWMTAHPKNPLTGVSGVYRVHLLQYEDPSRYFPIHRFGGIDHEGILKVGQTRNLGQRRIEFRAAIMEAGRHGDGEMFHYLYDICEVLRQIVGPKEGLVDRILFTYIRTSPSRLILGERRSTDQYVGCFAELPPVNSLIRGKKIFYKH
jgi:hypothetical protein